MGVAELALREAGLFAAAGFLILGLGDLAVDLIWLARRLRRAPLPSLDDLPEPEAPVRLAVFVPAWDEGAVIARMLSHACAAWDGADLIVFVGAYPNDPATAAAVRSVGDPRIRLVVGPVPGPTSKADCLNRLWEAMVAEERRTGRGFAAILLHDAEDVVHSAEPALFARLIGRFDLVQIPVVPLIDPASVWIGGHYADEFAESHGKELVVRAALGAGLPAAGVGCAVSREALGALAAADGAPFDAGSLTEDYELGLRLRALGRSTLFARVAAPSGRGLVATRSLFPGRWRAAVGQKSRWINGIALAGWDRLGWSGGLAERWMRMRDRQSLLAALLLIAGYATFGLWSALAGAALATGAPLPQLPGVLALLLTLNLVLLGWRLAMRAGFTAAAYSWREGLRAVPRVAVSNLIAIHAAWRALAAYLGARRTGAQSWDKTDHMFPAVLPAE